MRSGNSRSRHFPYLGMTLVELLVVLAIVAAISGAVTFAISRTVQEQQEKECLTNMLMVEAAKDEYARDHVGQPMDQKVLFNNLVSPRLGKSLPERIRGRLYLSVLAWMPIDVIGNVIRLWHPSGNILSRDIG